MTHRDRRDIRQPTDIRPAVRTLEDMVRRLDIARLRRQLRAEWKTTDREALFTVLARHARLSGNGQPMRCTPSREQLAAGHPGGLQSAYKIIYDNRAAARACERELHKNLRRAASARLRLPALAPRTLPPHPPGSPGLVT